MRRIDETAWVAACREAAPFSPLARLVGGKTSPLLWGIPTGLLAGQEKLPQAVRTQRVKSDLLADRNTILAQMGSDLADFTTALNKLALGYLLPAIAKVDKSDLTARLLTALLAVTEAAPGNESADAALNQLILGCELPLVLALISPDAKLAAALRKSALSVEAKLAVAWFDPFALPKANVRELLRPWLASLVRSHELLRSTETQFSEAARERLERMARHALRLSRPDGSFVLLQAAGLACDREFLTAAVLATKSTPPIAELAFGKHKTEPKPVKGMPAAPLYSPQASLAVLRNRWAAPQLQVTADFAREQVWLDLSSGNQSLLHGEWSAKVQIDGRAANPIGPWTEVCWHTDKDCDYLEIEQKLSGGWLMQRHLLLVRQDECLLMADSLLNEQNKLTPANALDTSVPPPRLEYSCSVPLAKPVSFVPQQESREGHLVCNKKPLALVMPLAMPEWRAQPMAGDLTSHDNCLRHSLRTNARNLFAPLWLDLSPTRFKNPATWRQLTIGESLLVQPRDVAVGYRVQVNFTQWLLYRSLAWRGNRTVLGKNFATDFVCCRFLPNGETQDILEVQ
ncbi:hypothetical protein ETAA8_24050 [Anatilimnocola aggregata]|uniref:Uncharacterized protein n=2 Tax=Anatilimnocola aggregata TaxID=2528021 RepID=A0A517YAR0_9BACT|nr:hypothetical protein ETAA8_24050 [Anatilimnocola aggregata]